jgi:hypothetical protein
VKFIDAVGVRDLWYAMSLEQKNALINPINAGQDARNTAGGIVMPSADGLLFEIVKHTGASGGKVR